MYHVGDPEFGDDVKVNDSIQNLIDNSPKLTSTDARIVLLDLYETTYGIFNHSDVNASPLALVAMQAVEDTATSSSLYERIEQFEIRQVYKRFGLSLIEFLELPRDVVIRILDLCGKRQIEEERVTNNLSNAIKGKIT